MDSKTLKAFIEGSLESARNMGLTNKQIAEVLEELYNELRGNLWLEQHYKGDIPPRLTYPPKTH